MRFVEDAEPYKIGKTEHKMCIQSSCTTVYNLSLGRGRRTLQNWLKLPLSPVGKTLKKSSLFAYKTHKPKPSLAGKGDHLWWMSRKTNIHKVQSGTPVPTNLCVFKVGQGNLVFLYCLFFVVGQGFPKTSKASLGGSRRSGVPQNE